MFVADARQRQGFRRCVDKAVRGWVAPVPLLSAVGGHLSGPSETATDSKKAFCFQSATPSRLRRQRASVFILPG